jgi:HK97 family phage prohead protease
MKTTDIVRRTFGFRPRAETLDEEARSIRVIASTTAIDSYDEMVEQKWKLERYSRNPVVLYHHNATGGLLGGSAIETLPIGRASKVGVVDGQLEATLHFVTAEANPLAEMVWQGVRQGSLSAVSVGFRPHTVSTEKRGDSELYVLSDNELFEISVVPLPANPEAVALGAESQREQLRRLAVQSLSAAGGGLEKLNMNETVTLQAELDAAKAAHQKALADATAALELAEKAQNDAKAATDHAAQLEAERDLVKQRNAVLAAELNAKAVKDLVGSKIYPAELEPMTQLRAKEPDLFDALMNARPNLTLTADVIGTDKPENTVSADPDSKLAALVRDAGKDE